ncbi:MAG: response regulator transcription factor [Cytophagales bacterium]
MTRTVILYALALALLAWLLKWLQFQFFVRDISLEAYLGLLALFFTRLGIWAGLRLTRKKIVTVTLGPEFVFNEAEMVRLGISKREHEVLDLMAKGMGNQEIADKLFVSLNTVKTHIYMSPTLTCPQSKYGSVTKTMRTLKTESKNSNTILE